MINLERYRNTLTTIMREIREPMMSLAPDTAATYLYLERTILPRIGNQSKVKNYMMPFLILVTNPCSHILRYGGCTMCGYSNLAEFKRKIPGPVVYEQFRRGLKLIRKIPHHEMVAVGTGGSFMHNGEVPADIQKRILNDLFSTPSVHYVNIEARSEYIRDESLKELLETVDDSSRLSIGVGLESSNDIIRDLCVNKTMSIDSYQQAIRLLRKYGVSPTTYVTLGKPFIDDWTNIVDAVRSIKFALEHGSDRVVLIRIGVHPNTLIAWLQQRGLYDVIKIWAVPEVLKRLPARMRNRVLIANPRLPRFARVDECSCSEATIDLLNEYKGTLDRRYLMAIDAIKCPHKNQWDTRLRNQMDAHLPIDEQIDRNYHKWIGTWENEHGRLLSCANGPTTYPEGLGSAERYN